MLVVKAEAGSSPRRASNFLSRRRKKVTKERATLLSVSLRCATGNLRCSGAGRAAELASRCALRSNNRSESDHEADVSFGTSAAPRPALRYGQPAVLGSSGVSLELASLRQSRALIRWPLRSSAHTEGRGSQNSRTATRAIASLGPLLWGQAPRTRRSACRVERSEDPCGCSAVLGCPPPVAAPAAGRLRGGMGASAPMLRHLTRRGCPSGAAQQQSEFHGAPRKRTAAGLPRSAAKGSQTGGRLLLPSFLGDARKEGAPPGAYPGTRPWHRHTAQSASNPQLRQTQPQRLKVTPFAINSVAASAYPISARTQKHLKPQRPTP